MMRGKIYRLSNVFRGEGQPRYTPTECNWASLVFDPVACQATGSKALFFSVLLLLLLLYLSLFFVLNPVFGSLSNSCTRGEDDNGDEKADRRVAS